MGGLLVNLGSGLGFGGFIYKGPFVLLVRNHKDQKCNLAKVEGLSLVFIHNYQKDLICHM